jgi:multiple sugar transport system substrate-binding protein
MSSKRSLLLIVTLALVLAACGATPEPQTIIETVEVEKEVPVEVTSIVEVEKEVPVEVTSIVEVEKEVPVEVTSVVEVEKEVAPEDIVDITLAYGRFLRISFGPGPAPFDAIKEAVSAQYPNINVQLNLTPDSMNAWHDALAVWLSAEDPTVDIYGMDTPWVKEFGSAGWAVPLNDLAGIENLEDSGLDTFSYEGDRLGIPFWGSLSGLFYRTDLLEEYGFEPPETFDDLVEAAQAITADNPEMSGFVWPGAKEESLVMVWASMLYGFGGEYFDDAGMCAADSPEGIAAVEFMANTIEDGISPPETSAWGAEEARTRFAEGNAVFLWHNADIVAWLDDPERSAVGGNWGLIPTPAQPDGRHSGITGGFSFAINPYTDNLEEAIKVLEVVASEEVQKAFAIAWGPVQYYKGLYDDPEVQEVNTNSDAINAILPSALNRPPSSNYAEVSTILQEEIHSAITGIKTVEAALEDACTRIDAVEQ